MSVRAHRVIALAAIAIASCGLWGCGDSSPDAKVIATVGKSKITQATLDQWMTATIGGGYREILSEEGPVGLVSDPPDYARCLAAAKQIVPSSGARSKLSEAQLRSSCRELYTAVSEEALSFLISALWRIEEEAEHGQGVSEAELTRVLDRIRSEQFPNPEQFARYLAERHRSISDERYLLRRNILNERLLNKLKAQAGSGAGGEKAFARLVLANNAKWISRTDCMPGYRSTDCKQYASSASASPSTAIVLERLKAGG